MPRRKIPQHAFMLYVDLGPTRSYRKVAERLGVSKRAVPARAAKERWQERLEEVEKLAQKSMDNRAQESIEEMQERHLKMISLIQTKAIEGLRSLPLAKPAECWRALVLSMNQERLVRGEPTERTELTVESMIKREYESWMTPSEPEPDDEDGLDDSEDVPDFGGCGQEGA